MERVAYLLTSRNNPHAPLRSNGMRGWYQPHRTGGVTAIRVIGVHTAESDPTSTSARSVARWQAFDARQPSSYHVLVDSDHLVRTLPDTATAFHIGSFNTPSVGLSFATRASWWGRHPAWDALALEHGAIQAADWCKRYSIPRRWLTRAQAIGGQRGFVRHSTMDPARRSDPGLGFPADVFLARVDALVQGVPPVVPKPDPEPEDDDVPELIKIAPDLRAVFLVQADHLEHVTGVVFKERGWKQSDVVVVDAKHPYAQLPIGGYFSLVGRLPSGDLQVWEWRVTVVERGGKQHQLLRRHRLTRDDTAARGLRDEDFQRLPPDDPWWRVPEA